MIYHEAMEFAARADDPSAFLQCWLAGDWLTIKRKWPRYHVDRELIYGDAAFDEGQAAFNAGEAKESNPHQRDDEATFPAWELGWEAAKSSANVPF